MAGVTLGGGLRPPSDGRHPTSSGSPLPPPNSRTARAEPALGAAVIRLAAVDSTQTHAARLAEDGAPDGTVVVADTQTAGKGRRGRVWSDAPGASLLMSVVVRSSLPITRLPLLSIAAGVALAEALNDVGVREPRLKWPNDVLVDGRKIAGVLLERRGDAVILGIGVNLDARAIPAELRAQATCVAEGGGGPDRDALLVGVLEAFARWRGRLEREGFEAVRERWTGLAETLGKRVSVDGVVGIAEALDGDGALLVATERGVARVVAGDVVAG
ncbi:MAG TPA: biotin--[acetyl-CoA-carboxylase] ligase [Terriglobales bacterium]|nr:biotin--[acetyl-CoA-carboxylase] ligase [Terriglobales bacterium]